MEHLLKNKLKNQPINTNTVVNIKKTFHIKSKALFSLVGHLLLCSFLYSLCDNLYAQDNDYPKHSENHQIKLPQTTSLKVGTESIIKAPSGYQFTKITLRAKINMGNVSASSIPNIKHDIDVDVVVSEGTGECGRTTLHLMTPKTQDDKIKTQTWIDTYTWHFTKEEKVTKIEALLLKNIPSYIEVEVLTYSVMQSKPSIPIVQDTGLDKIKDENGTIRNKNVAQFTWSKTTGADLYDVEWVWISEDDTHAPDPQTTTDFNKFFDYEYVEPVRITTSNEYYRTPLTYPKGKCYFRVRGVRETIKQGVLTEREEGEWSEIEVIDTDFQSDQNWQTAKSFTEEGSEYKQVITYYDALGSPQQSITSLNQTTVSEASDDQIPLPEITNLVGESKYNYEGQVTIQIPPTPEIKTTIGPDLTYRGKINEFIEEETKGKATYDKADNPNSSAPKLKTGTGGATDYFSGNNDEADIPNAEGYAYTKAQFVNDGTGRIRKQGGIGKEFQLDTKHATQFYYGDVYPRDLARLFKNNGTIQNHGEASHYKKYVTIDPNGQASVAYIDQAGRTVATALAGETPPNLDPLSSNKTLPKEPIELSNLVKEDPEQGTRTLDYTFLNTTPNTQYSFSYQPPSSLVQCTDCQYELTLVVRDAEENSVELEGLTDLQELPNNHYHYVRNKNVPPALSWTAIFPNVGEYNLFLELKVHLPDDQIIYKCIREDVENNTQWNNYISGINHRLDILFNEDDCQSCKPTEPCFQEVLDEARQNLAKQSCDYIYQQMRNQYIACGKIKLEDTPEEQLEHLEQHPEFLVYLFCSTRLVESREFDRKLQESIEWHDFTNNADPLFVLHHDIFSKSEFENRLNNKIDHLLNGFTGVPNTHHQGKMEFFIQTLLEQDGATTTQIENVKTPLAWIFYRGIYTDVKEKCIAQTFIDKGGSYVDKDASFFTDTNDKDYCEAYTQPIVSNPLLSEQNIADIQDQYQQILEQNNEDLDPIQRFYIINTWLNLFTEQCPELEKEHENYISFLNGQRQTYDHKSFPKDAYIPKIPSRGHANDFDKLYKFIQVLEAYYDHQVAQGGWDNLNIPAPHINDQFPFDNKTVFLKDKIQELLQQSCFENPTDEAIQQIINQNFVQSCFVTENPLLGYQNTLIYGHKNTNGEEVIEVNSTQLQFNPSTLNVTDNKNFTLEFKLYADERNPFYKNIAYNGGTQSAPIILINFGKNNPDGPNYRLAMQAVTSDNSPIQSSNQMPSVSLHTDNVDPELIRQQLTEEIVTTVRLLWMDGNNVLSQSEEILKLASNSCASEQFSIQRNGEQTKLTLNGMPIDFQHVSTGTNSQRVETFQLTNLSPSQWLIGQGYINRNGCNLNPCPFNTNFTFGTFTASIWDWRILDKTGEQQIQKNQEYLYKIQEAQAYSLPSMVPQDLKNELKREWHAPSLGGYHYIQPYVSNAINCADYCTTIKTTSGLPTWGPVTQETLEDICKEQIQLERVAYEEFLKDKFTETLLVDYFEEIKRNFGGLSEGIQVQFDNKEYHYMLYYYDLAGNLIQTVPPEGVDLVAQNHSLKTEYRYNNLGQLLWQRTPDGGETRFFYDKKGRLRLSQNDKQAQKQAIQQLHKENQQYSYTKYDNLGRITEVGQLEAKQWLQWKTQNTTQTLEELKNTLEDISDQDLSFPKVGQFPLTQITRTLYDQPLEFATIEPKNPRKAERENWVWKPNDEESDDRFTSVTFAQHELRGRVAAVQTFNQFPFHTVPEMLGFVSGSQTLYSYDIHGNVQQLAQVIPDLGMKITQYDYDLIVGNVNQVTYQPPRENKEYLEIDQFMHRYEYDADQKLHLVETSRFGNTWSKEARYKYFKHGPLHRLELGEYNIQGLDYLYNLQGWIKGVNVKNDETLPLFSKDAFSYQLHYFDGDFEGDLGKLPQGVKSFYNGNITVMKTIINAKNNQEKLIGQNEVIYTYDQLNRITSATSPAFSSMYQYDANGNILGLKRWEGPNGTGKLISDIDYGYNFGQTGQNPENYKVASPALPAFTQRTSNQEALGNFLDDPKNALETNQLGWVKGSLDIDYEYDEIGNLIQSDENVTDENGNPSKILDFITWSVYGKVAQTQKTTPTGFISVIFQYDAGGNRIRKTVTQTPKDDNNAENQEGNSTTTYYIRNSSGHILATYNEAQQVQEFNIYGAARIGSY